MTSLLPVGVYGLEVPAGDVMVPAQINFPGTVCKLQSSRPTSLFCYSF